MLTVKEILKSKPKRSKLMEDSKYVDLVQRLMIGQSYYRISTDLNMCKRTIRGHAKRLGFESQHPPCVSKIK